MPQKCENKRFLGAVDKAIWGNGKTGLIEDVTVLKEQMKAVKEEKTVSRSRISSVMQILGVSIQFLAFVITLYVFWRAK